MRRFQQATALLCVAGLCAVAPPALAQGHSRERRRRAVAAREHFENGKKAYQRGDYDGAIQSWKKAYELRDDPIYLYNIAQAYRQKDDLQKAIFYYREYTHEAPRARNRNEVEERIAELLRRLDQRELARRPPPATEPATPPPVPPPDQTPPPAVAPASDEYEAPRRSGRTLQVAGSVTAGVGAAATAAGIVFLLRSASIQKDLEAAAHSGEPWSADLVDKENQGRRWNTLGWVGIGAGAACVLGGATLYLLGAKERRRQLAVYPTGTGVIVTFAY